MPDPRDDHEHSRRTPPGESARDPASGARGRGGDGLTRGEAARQDWELRESGITAIPLDLFASDPGGPAWFDPRRPIVSVSPGPSPRGNSEELDGLDEAERQQLGRGFRTDPANVMFTGSSNGPLRIRDSETFALIHSGQGEPFVLWDFPEHEQKQLAQRTLRLLNAVARPHARDKHDAPAPGRAKALVVSAPLKAIIEGFMSRFAREGSAGAAFVASLPEEIIDSRTVMLRDGRLSGAEIAKRTRPNEDHQARIFVVDERGLTPDENPLMPDRFSTSANLQPIVFGGDGTPWHEDVEGIFPSDETLQAFRIIGENLATQTSFRATERGIGPDF